MKRPRSVTVISWIFILVGVLTLIGILRRLGKPDTGQRMQEYVSQHPIYFAYTHVAPVILIICGIFMLFGLRWGRWLVFVWFVQATIVDTMISPSHFWYPCVLFGLALCFLFRQPAMDYFRGAKQEIPKKMFDHAA